MALAGMGATVLLVGRDRGRGEAAVEEIRRRGGTAEFLQAEFSRCGRCAGWPRRCAPSMRG